MNTTMDSLVIDIQSTSTDATQGIDSLIERLTSLRDVLREVSTASNGLSSLKNIGSNIKTSRASKKQEKIEQPEIIAKNIQTTPLFDEMAGKIGKVDSATSMLQNKLNMLNVDLGGAKILSTFSNLNTTTTKYLTKAGSVVTVTDKMKNGFNSVDVSVRKTNPKVRTFADNLNTLVGVTNKVRLGLVATATAVVGTIKKMGEFVNKAGAEQEALNLFTVTMGKYAEEGTKWLQRFSNALYLDPVDVMQYMGSFNSLVKGLGVGAENSYKMSQNLTQLVYDLSSFKNISIQSAYEKLMSGISGELEPLRNVGVAMSEATLQTLAYELGIEKLVRNMTEAEKAQLRYIQIMRSSTEWQTDMGRTIVTPTNALRVMRQQFTQLGRAIGKVFIPIIMKMMPYVIAMTQLLTNFANKLAKSLGFEIADVDYSALGDLSAGVSDIGDSADETAKKLNTMLAPFDDLNVVQKKSESAGSGLSAFGGDLGVDLPVYDALANLNKEFGKGVEDAKAKLEGLIPTIKAVGIALAGMWAINKIANFVNSLLTIGKALKLIGESKAFTGFTGLLKSIPLFATLSESIKGIGLGIKSWLTGGATFGEMISFITPYLATFAQIVGGIATVILGISRTISGIKKIIEGDTFKGILQVIEGIAIVVAGIAILLGGWVVAIVAGVVAGVAFVIEHWSTIKDFFVGLWGNIKEGFGKLWDGIVEIFTPVGEWIYANVVQPVVGFFVSMWEGIKSIFSAVGAWFDTNVIQPIVVAFTPIVKWFGELFGSIWQTIKDIWNNIVGFIAGTVEIIQLIWSIVAPWFKEHIIEPVAEFFTGLWDGIKSGATWLWEGIKTIFNTVSTWFNDTIITPVSELFSTMWNNLKEGARQAWEGIKTIFSKVAEFFGDVFSKAWEKVKLVFSVGGKIFDGIKEGIVKAFTAVVNAIITGINKVVAIPFNGINKVINKIKNAEILGIKPFKDKLTTINVPQIPLFEQGGYPTSGDLFFANENGIPEMVGRIGNQTAVANNDQIATSLTNALLSALNQYDFGGGKSPTTIYIGNRKVYEGYGDYVADENDRYGTNMIKI